MKYDEKRFAWDGMWCLLMCSAILLSLTLPKWLALVQATLCSLSVVIRLPRMWRFITQPPPRSTASPPSDANDSARPEAPRP